MKKNYTIRIEEELLERARTIVYWRPDLTLNKLMVEALKVAVEKEENNGTTSYPPREGELKRGQHNLKK